MDIRIKRKKTLLALLLVVSVLFSACGKQETASTDTDDIDELKAQIESLAAENEELKQQLEKFTAEESQPAETEMAVSYTHLHYGKSGILVKYCICRILWI